MDGECKCSIRDLEELINKDFENIKYELELFFFNNNIMTIDLCGGSFSVYIDGNYEISILNQITYAKETITDLPLEFWIEHSNETVSKNGLEQLIIDTQSIREKILKYFGSHKPDIIGKTLKDLQSLPRTICEPDSEIRNIYYYNQILTIEVISREKLREIKFELKGFSVQQLLGILKIFEKDENYRW